MCSGLDKLVLSPSKPKIIFKNDCILTKYSKINKWPIYEYVWGKGHKKFEVNKRKKILITKVRRRVANQSQTIRDMWRFGYSGTKLVAL